MIKVQNIYYMLSYAFTTLQQGEYENIAAEEFENLHNLFAAILAKGIGRQLKQGLYRDYQSRMDNLSTMRGKINMVGTIQNHMAKKPLLMCEYDELSADNLLNQILKTTVSLLLRHADVEDQYKTELKKEMLFFTEVSLIDPQIIRWSAVTFHRNNQSYRILIGICQLILEGMLLTTEEGEYKLAKFVDDQPFHALPLGGPQKLDRPQELCKDAARIDIPRQQHRCIHHLGQTHVDKIALPEVYLDFRKASR